MPRYLTQHTLACLTRQGAEVLAQRMQAGGTACAERVLVNMLEGKMFVEFRADSREALEGWLKTEAMHFASSFALIPAKLSRAGSKPKACISIGSCASSGKCKAPSFNLPTRKMLISTAAV